MTVVDKALWVIERNSSRPLSLNAIAEACGVSRSHLASAFGTAAGLPVMRYLRARRLSDAARTLAGGAPDILTVALEAGYGSHEAFTRAFREQFGTTPEAVRDARSVGGLTLVAPLALRPRGRPALDPPRLVERGPLRVVGLSEVHSFATTIAIPAQWQRFMPFYEAIPFKTEEIPIGVTRAADEDGQFPYVCAVEVARFGEIPRELVKLEIGARRYAVYEHRRHVSTIYDTYEAIWNDALPAGGFTLADAPILEGHNATFDPSTGEGGLSLWIPLEESAT